MALIPGRVNNKGITVSLITASSKLCVEGLTQCNTPFVGQETEESVSSASARHDFYKSFL